MHCMVSVSHCLENVDDKNCRISRCCAMSLYSGCLITVPVCFELTRAEAALAAPVKISIGNLKEHIKCNQLTSWA